MILSLIPHRSTFTYLKILLLLAIGYFLVSCGSGETAGNTDAEPNWDIPTISEMELVERFAPLMDSDPGDSVVRQRNSLIEFIIEKQWDMQYQEPGIFYHLLTPGSEDHPAWGDKVVVHYNGLLLDGSSFDSSYRRQKPLECYIGNVIDGWNVGLPLMGEGGHGVFLIPAHMAYGEEGFGEYVNPGEHLLFQIALLEILTNTPES